MKCQHCGSSRVDVIDSREDDRRPHRLRRRKCRSCGKRYSTVEVPREWYKSVCVVLDRSGGILEELRGIAGQERNNRSRWPKKDSYDGRSYE